jgi:hypothetical protein
MTASNNNFPYTQSQQPDSIHPSSTKPNVVIQQKLTSSEEKPIILKCTRHSIIYLKVDKKLEEIRKE